MKREIKLRLTMAVGSIPIAIAVIAYGLISTVGRPYADSEISEVLKVINSIIGSNSSALASYTFLQEIYVNRNLILIFIIGYTLVLFAFYIDTHRKLKGEKNDK